MKYTWCRKKLKRKVHIVGKDGKTLCQVENCGTVLDGFSARVPADRKLCGICVRLNNQGVKKSKPQPSKRGKYRDPFLATSEWKRVRYMVIQQHGNRCSCCGRGPDNGAIMNVDHIKPRSKYPELALTLSNLQVLCSWCNQGKGNWDSTDWREPKLAVVMGEAIE